MYSFTEVITLAGKATGGFRIHPIVEIRLVGGSTAGFVQIVPMALIIEIRGEILTYLIGDIKTSDEQSAG